jgi:hypothetical protein
MTESTLDCTARISADFHDFEFRTENPGVGGSIPSRPTRLFASFHAIGSMTATPLCPGLCIRLDPGTTKNLEGRVFVMTPELRAMLEAQKAITEALQKKTGSVIPWVFHRTKHGWAFKSFRKAWQQACLAAGVPGVSCNGRRDRILVVLATPTGPSPVAVWREDARNVARAPPRTCARRKLAGLLAICLRVACGLQLL